MKTAITIDGERLLINGRPTYEGREYRGVRVEGLLSNSRMVQDNLEAALSEYASWRFYHQGYGTMYKDRRMDWTVKLRECEYAHLSGFQTVPVNWLISDEHKLAFFQKLKEITGGGA